MREKMLYTFGNVDGTIPTAPFRWQYSYSRRHHSDGTIPTAVFRAGPNRRHNSVWCDGTIPI